MTARRLIAASLLGALAVGTALANDNVLYRCLDGQGNPAFTNSRQGFNACREVGRYPRTSAPAAKVRALPVTPPAETPAAATAGTVAAAGAAKPPTVSAAAGNGAAPPAKPARTVQRGAVYRYLKDGVAHYTNVNPGGGRASVLFTYAIENCIACQIRSTVDWNHVALRLDDYADEIALASAAHGVDAALVRAVIHAESAFRVNALSHAGAQGLMQLMPATAARFGVGDVYDPAANIAGGVEYLAWLLKRFAGDVRLASAGYNAGEGAVDRHGGVPPYAETQVYVERVGILHARYRAALDAAVPAATIATSAVGASP